MQDASDDRDHTGVGKSEEDDDNAGAKEIAATAAGSSVVASTVDDDDRVAMFVNAVVEDGIREEERQKLVEEVQQLILQPYFVNAKENEKLHFLSGVFQSFKRLFNLVYNEALYDQKARNFLRDLSLRSEQEKKDKRVAVFVNAVVEDGIREEERQKLVKAVQKLILRPYFVNANENTKLLFLSGVFRALMGIFNYEYNEALFDEKARNFLRDLSLISEQETNLMVKIDYKIVGTEMSHRYDLDYFHKTVVNVASAWSEHKHACRYVAPYFWFVQSSGMGKTKIMYEFATRTNKDSACKISCDLVVSTYGLLRNDENVFAMAMDFPSRSRCGTEVAKEVHNYLNATFLEDSSPLRRQKMRETHVILFDEAQFLLKEEFGEPAFLFRCIRAWLRSKRIEQTVVAVFTGTSLAFNSYRVKDDKFFEINSKSCSRDTNSNAFYKEGSQTFAPFLCTTTMGVLRTASQHDYELSIGYGRPLFAAMWNNNQLQQRQLGTVLHRLLLTKYNSTTDWHAEPLSWLSVLATRVQVGATTANVTAELVRRGYANLISVSEDETGATFSCLPDPVCARLAMSMMDKGWEFPHNDNPLDNFKGQEKLWWIRKLQYLYSSGLCHPDTGDVGEVLVALYFLFCGDECRQQLPNNEDYCTYSISLDGWIDSLLTPIEKGKSDGRPQKRARVAPTESLIEISFIQVCRNCLRHFGRNDDPEKPVDDPAKSVVSWAAFADQEFLSHLYAAGTAFYTYPGCPLIDLAAPMRITTGEDVSFGALLVSIRSKNIVCPADAATICLEMKAKADGDNCKRTLCLLVVLGPQTPSNDKDWKWSPGMLSQLAKGDNVSAVLHLPCDDRFRLTRTFDSLTKFGTSQLLESHAFIRALSEQSKKELFEGQDLDDVAQFSYSKKSPMNDTQEQN